MSGPKANLGVRVNKRELGVCDIKWRLSGGIRSERKLVSQSKEKFYDSGIQSGECQGAKGKELL